MKENQKIAIHLLASGVTQTKVAERLSVSIQTIINWMKNKRFHQVFQDCILKRDEAFEQEMERMLSMIPDRIFEIIQKGKDADSLKAIEIVLRKLGKAGEERMSVMAEERSEEEINEWIAGIARRRGLKVKQGPYGIITGNGSDDKSSKNA